MLIIKITLADGTEVATGTILNDRSGTYESGNYEASLAWKGEYLNQCKVKGFPRLKLSPWHLLHRVLDATVGQEQCPKEEV